jgi:bifunctional ADP-heptose synthase (sugar kinase/adenylyltransferase)
MKELSDRISVNEDYDRFARRNIVLGDLTEKQYAALADCVRLSPGYSFEVVRYEEHEGAHGSAATHVKVWKDGNDHDYVALVGKDCAQYYDSSKETEQAVKRVSHRVYRKCVYFA